jgi:hypothetical protein
VVDGELESEKSEREREREKARGGREEGSSGAFIERERRGEGEPVRESGGLQRHQWRRPLTMPLGRERGGEKTGVRFWLGEADRRGRCGVWARAAGRTVRSAAWHGCVSRAVARGRRGGREKRERAAVGPTCKRERGRRARARGRLGPGGPKWPVG